MRAALARLRGATPPQLVLDAGHGGGKILGGASPAGGEQAGRAVEGLDAEAGIVGEGRQPGCLGGRMGLEGGVLGEHGAGLVRLGQAELSRRDGLDAVLRQQLAHLAQLARIMRRGDNLAGQEAVHD